MRLTLPRTRWTHRTVEWSPKLAAIQSQLNVTHYVFPDLPTVYSQKDRSDYLNTIPPHERVQTIATCRHDVKSLKDVIFQADKLLLVGGNDQTPTSLSTVEAARILQCETDTELWGVADPNDRDSLERVQEKIEAGITGFLTQPLLSSRALETLEACHTEKATFIAGMAMPRTAKNLQFWLTLLDKPDLECDPLFKSHIAFFQSSCYTPMDWIRREIQNLETKSTTIDGIHFMPMNNTDDLVALIGGCLD